MALAVCSATLLAPVRGDERGPTVLEKGLFSYQAPPGWTVQQENFSKYPVSTAPRRNGFAANIDVVIARNSQSLDDYVRSTLAALRSSGALRDVRMVERRPFSTAAGLDGLRVEVAALAGSYQLREFLYFFDGGSANKLVVTASCLESDAARDALLFDASLKTFSLE